MDIPRSVLKKLARIEELQREVKSLVSYVQQDMGIENVIDDDLWNWGMHVDRQGDVYSAKDSETLLRSFLEMKNSAR